MRRIAQIVVAFVTVAGLGNAMAGVSGSAGEMVKVRPTLLRMTVTLQGQAERMDKALEDIKSKMDSAKEKLLTLKPVQETLVVSGPFLKTPTQSEMERMRYMVQRRFGSEGEEAEKKKKQVTLSAVVAADWELSATDPVELTREVHRLRQEIEKAVTPASPKKEAATEEEEERMLRQLAQASGEGAAGKPLFTFVAKAPRDKLAEARNKAFAKARENASVTAAAAGEELGKLTNISSQVTSTGGEDYEHMRYYRRAMMNLATPSKEVDEGVSSQMTDITFLVTVNVAYNFKSEKGGEAAEME